MGTAWRDHPSWALVGELSEVAGLDLAALLVEAGPEALRSTRNAQLATFTLSLVALDAARQGPLKGLPAGSLAAVAGHSLGEYTALVAAGALGVEQGARLVGARGLAMQVAADANPGTMVAVIGVETADAAKACESCEGAWVANDNSPGQVVVAGTAAGVERAGAVLLQQGAKRLIPLQVGGAFHTPLMQPAQHDLDAAIARAKLGAASCAIVTNFDAKAHFDGFDALLSSQLCSPVRWRESLATLAATGARLFVELGPGTELSGMVRRTVPGVMRANVAKPEDLDALARALETVQAPC